ncbi:MAG: ribosome maturation factor RimM [Tissierellia bacterium]|nr:ribosome maturation factor RimM [Tissierellia bacterium]
MSDNRVLVGRITSAHGIRGEVHVYPYTDDLQRLLEIPAFYLEGEEEPRQVEKARPSKNLAILSLEGIDSRNQAELLKKKGLYILREQRKELEEDQYFQEDLVGLVAYDSEGGQLLGTITEVQDGGGQSLLVLSTPQGKSCLIPFVRDLVPQVNLEEGSLKIQVIEGLIP